MLRQKDNPVKNRIVFNGEGGIWTLAPRERPTPLAGAPLQPLEYFSSWIFKTIFNSLKHFSASDILSKNYMFVNNFFLSPLQSLFSFSPIFFCCRFIQIVPLTINNGNDRQIFHIEFTDCFCPQILISNHFTFFATFFKKLQNKSVTQYLGVLCLSNRKKLSFSYAQTERQSCKKQDCL